MAGIYQEKKQWKGEKREKKKMGGKRARTRARCALAHRALNSKVSSKRAYNGAYSFPLIRKYLCAVAILKLESKQHRK
jgi:hypothetical protein